PSRQPHLLLRGVGGFLERAAGRQGPALRRRPQGFNDPGSRWRRPDPRPDRGPQPEQRGEEIAPRVSPIARRTRGPAAAGSFAIGWGASYFGFAAGLAPDCESICAC